MEIIKNTNNATARKLLKVVWKLWKFTQSIRGTEERERGGGMKEEREKRRREKRKEEEMFGSFQPLVLLLLE